MKFWRESLFPASILSINLSILSFYTVNATSIRNNSAIGFRSSSIAKGSDWRLSSLSSQVSSEPYTYQNLYSHDGSSYYPSYYNLSRQDDNNNGFGFDNGGNGGFGIGGTGGGNGGGFGVTGGGGSGGGGGIEALGIGGGILAAIGLAILAIFVIPLLLLLLLGLLILPFSPLLLLLLLLLIPAAQKKIVFGEPPGNGIFPRSSRTTSDYFMSNFESIFKLILQAIESEDLPCSDDISCQNSLKNEVGAKRENPAGPSEMNPTKELPEWKKVLKSAIQQTQAFTMQVVKRINNMKNNVSKIGTSAAASAISKISKIAS